MQSREGAIFFVINIVGNFGTVFLDSKWIMVFYNRLALPACSGSWTESWSGHAMA